MIVYTQRQYYWIPRIFGADPETGTYAVFPAGGWQWISDQDPNTIPFNPAPGLQQRALHLPSFFPRKAYLSGVEIALSNGVPLADNTWNEFAAWVDPRGHFFNSGTPHGAEPGSNFVDCISLFHVVQHAKDKKQVQRWHRDFVYPIPLDRDLGDLIGVKGGFGTDGTMVFVGFKFLVPEVAVG